jgi:protein-S-isoprenylcysteine O-methyltransferase Ste14
MAVLALVLVVAWIALVAGLRSYVQLRATGELGVGVRDRPGSPQWWSRRISIIGIALSVAAPLAELVGVPAFSALDPMPVRAAGVAIVLVGIGITLISQAAMGASWRADVDPEARTELITTGPFRFVRNPTLFGTATTAIGLALMAPNVLSAAMLVAFLVAIQIQVRLVEEPYLLRIHGNAYRRYAARVGRFLPGVGRLKA